MNHPIVLCIQANDAFEQIKIPIVHEQILRCKAIAKRKRESRQRHNVFSKVETSGKDDCHQKHG
jgi:hypothetical protein